MGLCRRRQNRATFGRIAGRIDTGAVHRRTWGWNAVGTRSRAIEFNVVRPQPYVGKRYGLNLARPSPGRSAQLRERSRHGSGLVTPAP